jgi:hypothetical protein
MSFRARRRQVDTGIAPILTMCFRMPVVIPAALAGLVRLCLILGGCLALSGCLVLPARIAAEMEPARPGEHNPYAKRPAPEVETAKAEARPHPAPELGTLPLASGQIVVLDAAGPRGFFVSLMSADYWPWTHIGIRALEADGPVVYDTDGDLNPVPGLPPATFATGRARRVPFAQYVGSDRLVGIYALPPGVDAGKVVAFARGHYERGTPFDPYFNAEDGSALYCAELVALALALEAGGAPPVKPIPMRANRSYALIREWLQMRTPGLIVPGQLVDHARLVAQWYPGLSPAQLDAHFEIRRELLRRFDVSTRIGFLLGWRDSDVFLREDVFEFAVDALKNFRTFEDDIDSIRREVRRLADLYFVSASAGTAAAGGGHQ